MRRLLTYLLAALAPAAAWAEERFPPPEFSAGHKLPVSTMPPPRAELLLYLDVVVLLAALLLAAHLVHKRRWRNGVFALAAFSVAYFGFYRKGCVCSVGSIQNVAYAATHHDYALPISVALFFLLPLLVALFYGRVFCAAVCPLGCAQDLVLLKPVKVPARLEHALGLIPYLVLGLGILFAATGSTFLVCQYDPIVPFFRRSGSGLMLGIGAATLILGMFVGRPYCRFFCPYGVLLRWLSVWSRRQVTITPDICTQCRLCEQSCPFGAIREPTPEPGSVARREGKARLRTLVLLLPVLMLAGSYVGQQGAGVLARMDPTVRLADRVWLEEHGKVKGTTPASDAFRTLGQPAEELYRTAAKTRLAFDTGGRWFGAWVALVFVLKLIFLTIRRGRKDYVADPAACVACGRCYLYCPQEHLRLGHPVDVPDAEPAVLAAAGGRASDE